MGVSAKNRPSTSPKTAGKNQIVFFETSEMDLFQTFFGFLALMTEMKDIIKLDEFLS